MISSASPKRGTGRKKDCIICGTTFGSGRKDSHRDSKQWAKAKFCSIACYGRSNKGKKRPQHVLDKMRAGQKKEYPQIQGKNHWNWKGGITDKNRLLRNTPKYNDWRKAVYRRDRWTCQDCGKKQRYPIAHHIKSWKDYPSLRYTISNGITLCRSCHKIRHKEIGLFTQFRKSN